MKKELKKRFTVILSGLVACSFVMCGGSCGESHLGLYAGSDGALMKDGEEFYGVGVNYYALVNGSFKKDWDISGSLEGLEILASYDVRVVRFNLCVYYANEWEYVIDGEENYLAVLDAVVDKAAALDIGLIPCFFWHPSSVPDYFDEPAGTAWADINSRTMKFVLSFTETIVTRYAESSAIYGWEFGNEINLSSDNPD